LTISKINNHSGVGLDEFLTKWETKDFLLGTNDCIHFISDYLKECKGLRVKLPKYGTRIGAVRASKRMDLFTEYDANFTAVPFPMVGDLTIRPAPKDTITGYVLGICVGSKAAYLGQQGLVFYKLDPNIETYWKP